MDPIEIVGLAVAVIAAAAAVVSAILSLLKNRTPNDDFSPTDPPGPIPPGSVVEIKPALKISTGRLPHTEGAVLFGRENEMARLDAAWEDPGTRVISLVASGGVGKTALVKHWLAGMAARTTGERNGSSSGRFTAREQATGRRRRRYSSPRR